MTAILPTNRQQTHYSAELIERCHLRNMATSVTLAAGILGEAVDAGIISLDQVLDLVRSCNDADELGDALAMLAASSYCLIPPPAGRAFICVGEPDGGA